MLPVALADRHGVRLHPLVKLPAEALRTGQDAELVGRGPRVERARDHGPVGVLRVEERLPRGLDGLSRGRVEEKDRGEHLRPAVGPVGVLYGVGQRGRLGGSVDGQDPLGLQALERHGVGEQKEVGLHPSGHLLRQDLAHHLLRA